MIYFLALILALLPSYLVRFHVFGLPTTLLETLIGVFLLATLLQLKKLDFSKLKQLKHLNWAMLLFILAGIISTAISPDKAHALGQLKAFIIEPILLFYAAVLLFAEKDLEVPVQWLFGSASIIGLFGLIQYVTYIGLPMRFWGTGAEAERISSVFDYPNALALYLAPLFGFFLVLLVNKYPVAKRTGLAWAGLVLQGLALLLTFSRGAWFAVAATTLLFCLGRFGIKKIWPAVLLIVALLFIPAVRQRISLGLHDPSSQAHGDLMKVGINKLLQNPILGNGLAGFRTTLEQVKFSGEILNYPHNIFLNFWLELGLLGLISFVWIIALTLEQNKKHPNKFTLAAGVFLIILILHGLVDAPYFKNDLSVLFWFVVFLAFS